MARLMRHLPAVAATAWILLAKLDGFGSAHSQMAALFLTAAGCYAIRRLAAAGEASPIHKGMVLFTAAASLGAWMGPPFAWPVRHPVATLYAVLFLVAALPPLLGREMFTAYFARKSTPPAVWTTYIFLAINRRLTTLWALLFAVGFASALIPGLLDYRGFFWETLFEALVPAALMLGIGATANKLYPRYYQRRFGIAARAGADMPSAPARETSSEPRTETPPAQKEIKTMKNGLAIVAVNGSPHAGIGNTAMMLEMLRRPLAEEGLALEVIHLGEHAVEYCVGCGVCMEKGRCWIQDDHAGIVERLLAADGVILASPVYFLQVTAQLKTFLDRSLAFGHKPQPRWKPGLAVSVSAGYGETQTAEYLGSLLRVFGAFSVGRLTALAAGPGEFLGRPALEARAHDLARDLAQAVKEKRRYPATDSDLIFYRFMGALVREHRESIMKNDFEHWEKHGLYRDFEAYVQQEREKTPFDPGMRKAWIQETVAQHRSRRAGKKPEQPPTASPPVASHSMSCRELLKSMPLGFDPTAARGLEAVYQFDVSGEPPFQAHLKISGERCSYHEGPAAAPGIVVRTPADVWVAVAAGELDGQQAFMSGKYTVEGDLSLLLKLKTLFPR